MRGLFALLSLIFHTTLTAQTLSIQEDQFLLDNEPFEMWGIRVASASQSDSLTGQLIAALDSYKTYGVNTINVYIQGSSGGFSDPFSKNDLYRKHISGGWKRSSRLVQQETW